MGILGQQLRTRPSRQRAAVRGKHPKPALFPPEFSSPPPHSSAGVPLALHEREVQRSDQTGVEREQNIALAKPAGTGAPCRFKAVNENYDYFWLLSHTCSVFGERAAVHEVRLGGHPARRFPVPPVDLARHAP
jgi:hypothetical protein